MTQDEDTAVQRVIDINALAVASLAALTHFPHETDDGVEGKRKVNFISCLCPVVSIQ